MSEFYRNRRGKGEFSSKDFPRGRGGHSRGDKDAVKKPVEKTTQPTILIKTRESELPRSTSPAGPSVTPSRKDVTYQIQAKTPAPGAVAPIPMLSTISLLSEDSFTLHDSCLEYLLDQNEFLVVGCLGYQGVGKSTIMSLLAQPNVDLTQNEKLLFKQHGLEDQTSGRSLTSGIDMFVTSNRMILLDCQPILSSHLMLNNSRKPTFDNVLRLCSLNWEPHLPLGLENISEMESLLLVAFLFSVCHVVIYVQDYFFDPDAIRFLQTAEMLKPSTSTPIGEEMVEYFPHLVLIHNMAEDWEFQPHCVKKMQEVYTKAFSNSRLQIHTGFGIANGDVSPILDIKSCGELVNLFLLPQMSSDDEAYTGHPSFKNLFRHLRSQILSTPRTSISHTPLTEKNWYHYSSKVWEGIQKSPFFAEYHRLISSL